MGQIKFQIYNDQAWAHMRLMPTGDVIGRQQVWAVLRRSSKPDLNDSGPETVNILFIIFAIDCILYDYFRYTEKYKIH